MDPLAHKVISWLFWLDHDGVYKTVVHFAVPAIARKNGTLTAQRHSYNDVHGCLLVWGIGVWFGVSNSAPRKHSLIVAFRERDTPIDCPDTPLMISWRSLWGSS